MTTLSVSASSVYVVTAAQQFGVVNLATGAFSQIGSNTPEPSANLVAGPNGTFYSLAIESGSLQTINPATGVTKIIGPTGLGAAAFSLGEVNGKLYLTDLSNNFYTINPATGAATLMGPSGVPADPAIPFTMNADGTLNLCDESLYNIGNKLYLTFDAFKIDPATLIITDQVEPALWQIDPLSGMATEIGSTAANLDTLFEADGTVYGVRVVTTGFSAEGPESVNKLVTLNLTNGDTTFLRDIDPSAGPIFGAASTPEPASILLVSLGVAAIFMRRYRIGMRTGNSSRHWELR
jgi:hypothetical protein